MGDDDKPGKTQDELKASISEKKDVWTAKPNGTVGLLERSQVYGVRQVKDCLVDMLAYASDLEQGLVLDGVSCFKMEIFKTHWYFVENTSLSGKILYCTG